MTLSSLVQLSAPIPPPNLNCVHTKSQSVCCVWDGNSTIYLWPIVSHPNDALETFLMLFWLISFVECLPEDVGGVLLFYNTVGIRLGYGRYRCQILGVVYQFLKIWFCKVGIDTNLGVVV